MILPKPPRHQRIGFIISMPFITLALAYILYDERLFVDFAMWPVIFPVLWGLGYVSFRMHYLYHLGAIRRHPSLMETRKRVMHKIPIYFFVMSPSVLIIFLVFHLFHIQGYSLKWEDLFYGLVVGFGVNIIFETLWEVMYIIEKYKETAEEKERIEQMHLQQEFNNLKQKVNPHFLFNSFNTLSSLITEDKDKAEAFLDELSKVYRYLLRSNETGVSTVEQEQRFIDSYAQLLKTRYGDGFHLDMQIDPRVRDRHIPSLTLQLLVENAVKHNVVSRTTPVRVIIRSTPDGYLVVENNLNKKAGRIGESTGIGLSNIREKYRLLHREDLLMGENEGKFVVRIPVL